MLLNHLPSVTFTLCLRVLLVSSVLRCFPSYYKSSHTCISNELVRKTRGKACHPNPKKDELLCWGKKKMWLAQHTTICYGESLPTGLYLRCLQNCSAVFHQRFIMVPPLWSFWRWDGFFFPSKVYIVSGGESSTRVVTFHFLLPLRALPQLQVSILFDLPGWIKGEKKNWTGKRESALCFKMSLLFWKSNKSKFYFFISSLVLWRRAETKHMHHEYVGRALCVPSARGPNHTAASDHTSTQSFSPAPGEVCVYCIHTLKSSGTARTMCNNLILSNMKLPNIAMAP